jgi:hypothetical protein
MPEIALRRRDGAIVGYALVDQEDYERLGHLSWCLSSEGYVWRIVRRRDGRRTHDRLHRVIMDAPQGVEVDHIDGNPLNNRRENLRLVTHQQNQQNRPKPHKRNTSGYRNVSLDKRRGKWTAYGRFPGKTVYLGGYDDIEEAARVARAFRREHMPFSEEADDR